MASEIRSFAVTVAAGTAIATPQLTDLAMPPRIVREINVVIPPGPNGLVGFALGAAGQAVLPYNAGAWIIANGESIHWPLTEQIDSGAWQVKMYNTGNYPHTLQFRFLLDTLFARQAATLGFVDLSTLTGNLAPEVLAPFDTGVGP